MYWMCIVYRMWALTVSVKIREKNSHTELPLLQHTQYTCSPVYTAHTEIVRNCIVRYSLTHSPLAAREHTQKEYCCHISWSIEIDLNPVVLRFNHEYRRHFSKFYSQHNDWRNWFLRLAWWIVSLLIQFEFPHISFVFPFLHYWIDGESYSHIQLILLPCVPLSWLVSFNFTQNFKNATLNRSPCRLIRLNRIWNGFQILRPMQMWIRALNSRTQ